MTDESTEQSQSNAGRPTDYRLEFCQKAAELCIGGATDFEVATHLGVCVRTIYRWKAEHSEFSQALKVGKELADDRVEAALYHRAVGYSHAAVKIMQNNGIPVIVPYTEHVPPDVGAATMWLTNRRSDDWRSKQITELTGKDGGPILTKNADELSDKELESLARAGRAAPTEPEAGAT
jgi:hypothetical protein